MTGAGFGGACVALVLEDSVDAFVAAASAAYVRTAGLTGEFTVCRAVDGARILAG
jgi:galactokinase